MGTGVIEDIETQLLDLLKHEEMLAYWEFSASLPSGTLDGFCRVSRSTQESSCDQYCSIIIIIDTPEPGHLERAEKLMSELNWDKLRELIPAIGAVLTVPSINSPDGANLVTKKNLITSEGFEISKHFVLQSLYPAFVQMSHFACGDLLFWEKR